MDVLRIFEIIVLIYPFVAFAYFIGSKICRIRADMQEESEFVITARNEKVPEVGSTFEMYAPGRHLKIGDAYPVVDKSGDVLAMAECVADVSKEKRGLVNVFRVGAKDNKERRNLGRDVYRFEILE